MSYQTSAADKPESPFCFLDISKVFADRLFLQQQNFPISNICPLLKGFFELMKS